MLPLTINKVLLLRILHKRLRMRHRCIVAPATCLCQIATTVVLLCMCARCVQWSARRVQFAVAVQGRHGWSRIARMPHKQSAQPRVHISSPTATPWLSCRHCMHVAGAPLQKVHTINMTPSAFRVLPRAADPLQRATLYTSPHISALTAHALVPSFLDLTCAGCSCWSCITER